MPVFKGAHISHSEWSDIANHYTALLAIPVQAPGMWAKKPSDGSTLLPHDYVLERTPKKEHLEACLLTHITIKADDKCLLSHYGLG